MDSSIQTGCWGETSVIWHTTPTSKLTCPSPPPDKQAGIPSTEKSKIKKIRLKTFNICHLWHDRLIIQPGTLTITSRKTDRIPA